jgi:hypothetical protein
MSVEKLERLCESQLGEVKKHPHVWKYGVYRDGKETGIAVIHSTVDDDVNETYTEIDEAERKRVARLFHPNRVRFYESPMRTFQEWLNGVEKRKNPIIGKEFSVLS